MKKLYVLIPSFMSLVVILLSTVLLPGIVGGDFTSQYYFGYPFQYLAIDNKIDLSSADTLFEYMGVNTLAFLLDFIIFFILCNALMLIFKIIRSKIKSCIQKN